MQHTKRQLAPVEIADAGLIPADCRLGTNHGCTFFGNRTAFFEYLKQQYRLFLMFLTIYVSMFNEFTNKYQ